MRVGELGEGLEGGESPEGGVIGVKWHFFPFFSPTREIYSNEKRRMILIVSSPLSRVKYYSRVYCNLYTCEA